MVFYRCEIRRNYRGIIESYSIKDCSSDRTTVIVKKIAYTTDKNEQSGTPAQLTAPPFFYATGIRPESSRALIFILALHLSASRMQFSKAANGLYCATLDDN